MVGFAELAGLRAFDTCSLATTTVTSPMRLVTFRDPHNAIRVGRLDGDRVVELQAFTTLEWLQGQGHGAPAGA